jgi:hypothetical protein
MNINNAYDDQGLKGERIQALEGEVAIRDANVVFMEDQNAELTALLAQARQRIAELEAAQAAYSLTLECPGCGSKIVTSPEPPASGNEAQG